MANTKVYIVPDATGKQRSAYPAGNYVAVNAPTGLTATVDGSTIVFHLTDTNSGAASYVIQRSATSNGTYYDFATGSTGATTITTTGNPIGTFYYRAVGVISSVRSAAASSSVSATVAPPSSGFSVGQTIEITGSGFGEGPQVVKFEDFETGTPGALLSSLGFSVVVDNQPNPTNTPPYVIDTDGYAGTKCGFADCSTQGDCAAYVSNLDTEELYISAWIKPELLTDPDTDTDPSDSNGYGDRRDTVKGIRAHANNGPNVYTSYPGFMDQETFDVSEYLSARLQFNPNTTSSGVSQDHIDSHPTCQDRQWTRQQFHYRMSTPGVADGFLHFWQNKTKPVSRVNITTRNTGVSDRLHSVFLPFYYGNGVTGNWKYDLVTIQKGVGVAAKRVEIGDSPERVSSTKVPETLEVISWSDTSIQAKLHKTTFTGTAYLYVVDQSDSVIQTKQVTLS